MTKKTALEILNYLKERYPNPVPKLKFNTPYELLVAVILSAQCTDDRVNKVTEVLFKQCNTPEKMLELSSEQLEKYIYSCGFYHNKAKHILSVSKDIIEKFGGEVPSDFNALKSLDGVGQKTANVVWSVAFGGDAIAVDTHVFRVSNRLGLANANTPLKVEEQLKRIIPKDRWSESHHFIIFYGREICSAKKPKCEVCQLKSYCKYFKENTQK